MRRWGTTLMVGAGNWATDNFKTLFAGLAATGASYFDNIEIVDPTAIKAGAFDQPRHSGRVEDHNVVLRAG